MNNMLLFKYVSPDATPKVFEGADEILVRFGLPHAYNDPYELFLQPDRTITSEEERAFYDYFLGKVVEAPVACFSRRPDSVVMWAHYGRDGGGVCLALDEDAFIAQLPVAFVGDIDYTDGPATIDSGYIRHAFMTGKRRHTFFLLAHAHRAAYFRKRIDWQYEAERRVVVIPDAVEDRNGVLLCRVKPEALRYIILGPRTTPTLKELCAASAQRWNVPLLELRIGARTFTPFFTHADTTPSVWTGEDFEAVQAVCGTCGEPANLSDAGLCEWCSISEKARIEGPRRSMLTATLAMGIDEGIPLMFQGMEPRGHLVAEAPLEQPNKRK
jgi:hypothetical protein